MTSACTRWIVLVTALFALLLSGCTSTASDGHTDHDHGQPTGFNDADVMFAQMMIPHHEQAVQLSKLAPGRSDNPQVLQLATAIEAAQAPEIEKMKGFLAQWNQTEDTSGHDGMAGHDGMETGMQGMVDDATMQRLESLKGQEFDTLWLQSMIGHHEGAIAMAKDEIANGESTDAKALATTIADTQQAEIGQMKQLLGG
jgi:uncharacterized protein (DUF305 family)